MPFSDFHTVLSLFNASIVFTESLPQDPQVAMPRNKQFNQEICKAAKAVNVMPDLRWDRGFLISWITSET
jgi:hypothetical protein